MNEDDWRKEVQDLRELVARIPARHGAPVVPESTRFYKLTKAVHRTAPNLTANATRCKRNGEALGDQTPVDVRCDYRRGYFFIDSVVEVREIEGKLQIQQDGDRYIGGNFNPGPQINKTNAFSGTLANGKTGTVYARCGAIGSEKAFGALWDDYNQWWEADPIEC